MRLSNGCTIELGEHGDRYVLRYGNRTVIGYRSAIRALRRRVLAELLAQAQEHTDLRAALNLAERLES